MRASPSVVGRRPTQAATSCCAACASCPTRWSSRWRTPAAIAEAAQQLAPARRYWAIVGNGLEPHRRRGGADQALRALLQVDRLRRDRGQEAHRPVLRAAHPRVRRRPDRLDRRRRRQGSRDLPRPQGGADRDRDRGDERFTRGAAGRDLGAVGAPVARVRALGDGRPPLRLRGGAGHRRAGPAVARGARRDRGGGRGRACRRRRRLLGGCAPRLEPLAARFFDGLRTGAYDGHLEASTAVRLASLFRYAHRQSCRSTRTRSSTGEVGTPSVVDRGSHVGAHPRRSRS